MHSEEARNSFADLEQETSVASSDLHDNKNVGTLKHPTALKEPQTSQGSQVAKESYADYIKDLPPPFWETKTTQAKSANDEVIAARINAVCAPVTDEQRKEDERLKSMSWRERWRDRKARREAEKENETLDSRPVERGSRAQVNVFGVNIQEKKRKR